MLSGRMPITAWGADPGGQSDSTTAINTAFSAGFAGVKFPAEIYFPAGTYRVSDTLASPPYGVSLIGVPGLSIIETSQATGDVLPISNWSVTVDGLSFSSSVTRTGGAYMHVSGAGVNIRNFQTTGAYTAIHVDGPDAVAITIDRGTIINSVGAGQGIVIYDSGLAAYFGHTIINSSTPDATNIQINQSGDIILDGLQSLGATYCLMISPGTGQVVTSIKATHCFFDHGGTNLFANPTGNGVFARSSFIGCWFGSGATNAVLLDAAAPTLIDDIRFIGCEMVLSTNGSGLAMLGNVQNIKVQGCLIANNLDGIYDARSSGANGALIIGNTIGAGGGLAGNSNNGIALGGAGDYSIYQGNMCVGNGVPLANGNTGTNNLISGNAGVTATVTGIA